MRVERLDPVTGPESAPEPRSGSPEKRRRYHRAPARVSGDVAVLPWKEIWEPAGKLRVEGLWLQARDPEFPLVDKCNQRTLRHGDGAHLGEFAHINHDYEVAVLDGLTQLRDRALAPRANVPGLLELHAALGQ